MKKDIIESYKAEEGCKCLICKNERDVRHIRIQRTYKEENIVAFDVCGHCMSIMADELSEQCMRM